LIPVVASLCCWSCAGPKKAERPPTPEIAVTPSPPPKEELEEILISQLEERKEPERIFSLSVRGQEIREVLLAFSKWTERNIVVDPDVSGQVTIDLKSVTLEEALDVLLTPLELQYRQDGTFIRVSKLEMETRVFFLHYMTTVRSGSASLSASTTGGGASSVNSSDEADPWSDIETGLREMLSPEGKLVVNKMAGSIQVTDFPRNFERIAEFLEEVEGSIQRQVMIEAKIVEVILSADHQRGLDWDAIAKISDAVPMTVRQGLGPVPPSGVFQIGVSNSDFSVLLDAMSSQGELNILSSPKVSTLNNQKAIMRVGTTDVFWEVKTTYDPETRKETTASSSRTVDVGIVLDVTPQISPEGEVTMHIHPSITDKIGESTFESQTTRSSVPILSVRETDTVVRVGDGQTIVIAGLMQEKKTEDTTKIPLLGDIPVLGILFRRTKYEKKKTELVILLTPTVLVGNRMEDLSRKELRKLL